MNFQPTEHDAIRSAYTNVTNIINGECFDVNGNLVTTDPTIVSNELATLTTNFNNSNYKNERLMFYPSIGDQLDLLWHMIDQGLPFDKTSNFYTTLASTKAKYPKPTGN